VGLTGATFWRYCPFKPILSLQQLFSIIEEAYQFKKSARIRLLINHRRSSLPEPQTVQNTSSARSPISPSPGKDAGKWWIGSSACLNSFYPFPQLSIKNTRAASMV
jgi:hypothetical protein